jgi:hypothetical protein
MGIPLTPQPNSPERPADGRSALASSSPAVKRATHPDAGRRAQLRDTERGIQCVVFSFDRAMQLDALLETMRRHVSDLYENVTVLFRASSVAYLDGYSLLRREYSEVQWVEESSFKSDLLSIIKPSGLMVFHTDDDMFFADVDDFELFDDEACFSFRLGLNISYSYSLDAPEAVQGATVTGSRVSWDWGSQVPGSFSYPLSLNGHVLRSDETRSLIEASEFANPSELESVLHLNRWTARPRMASFPRSRVVSIPANVVSRTFPNRHGSLYSTDELNRRFLAGERIAFEQMSFDAVASCHEEIVYSFCRQPAAG